MIKNGWVFEWDQTLDGKTAMIGGTSIRNEKYGSYPNVHIEFYNPTDGTLQVKDCNVLGITVDTFSGDAPYDPSYTF